MTDTPRPRPLSGTSRPARTTRRTRRAPALAWPALVVGVLALVAACGTGQPSAGGPGQWSGHTASSGAAFDGGGALGAGDRADGLFGRLEPGEELWIVERHTERDGLTAATDPMDLEITDDPGGDGERTHAVRLRDVPGTGGLLTRLDGRTVAVPLEHTSVRAHLQGVVAGVRVEQRFTNPYDRAIEATYVFPLHQDAAVTEFVMTLGDRRIRGVVREREEAERLYEAARDQGLTAALLTQERPNVFTQQVANILPGQRIEVTLDCFHTVTQDEGWFEWVFPMVVGPRYNPAGSRDGVGAVPHGARGASGQSTEVPYLRPGERSGHDVDLEVTLDAGCPLAAVECPTHELLVQDPGGGRVRARLARHERLPNRDLVLRWRVDAPRTTLALIEQADHALLTIHPPADLARLHRVPVELVCVVDTSGSMDGEPLDLAQRALHAALANLRPEDSFELIRFSNGSSRLKRGPVSATPDHLAEGRRWVDDLRAKGGTEMLRGVEAALRHRADPGRRRVVLFLTDGYIGNEETVLRQIALRADGTRVFTVAVGSSPNRFLLERMASEGDGVCTWLPLGCDAASITRRHLVRLSHPALEDLEIDWGARRVELAYPSELPDLFHGRPIHVVAKLQPDLGGGIWGGPVVVRGRVDGAWREITIPWPGPGTTEAEPRAVSHVVERADGSVDRDDVSWEDGGTDDDWDGARRVGPGTPRTQDSPRSPRGALPQLWARARIAQLTSEARAASGSRRRRLADEARDTALAYGLLSPWTAFLAVDTLGPRAPGAPVPVDVPVEVPAGVRYDTTVGDAGSRDQPGEWDG